MTTIAYKADTLSFDSQANDGSNEIISGVMTKGGRLADGSLWAFCGTAVFISKCKPWLAFPLGDPPEIENSDLIIVRRDGLVTTWEAKGWLEIEAPFLAWGSGKSIAMGAMYAGASAEQAVKIAADLDPWTGGKIHALTLAEIYAPPDEDLGIQPPFEGWDRPAAVDPKRVMREKLGLE